MKSHYVLEQEVRAARSAGLPVFAVMCSGWPFGVYIAPVFASREDAENCATRHNECSRGHYYVEAGT